MTIKVWQVSQKLCPPSFHGHLWRKCAVSQALGILAHALRSMWMLRRGARSGQILPLSRPIWRARFGALNLLRSHYRAANRLSLDLSKGGHQVGCLAQPIEQVQAVDPGLLMICIDEYVGEEGINRRA